MVVHYYTLAAIADELNRLFRNATIAEIYTQQKHQLCLTLLRERDETSVTISIEPGFNYMFWRPHPSRAKRNSTDLFPAATGATVTAVSVHPSDRTVIFHLSTSSQILCSLYNTATSNIFLTDQAYNILDAFKRAKSMIEESAALRQEPGIDALASIESFIATVRRANGKTLLQAMKQPLPRFGTLYVREVIARCGIAGDRSMDDCTDDEIESLFTSAREIVNECAAGRAYVYTHGKREPLLACCRLRHLEGWTCREYPSANEAVRSVVSAAARTRQADAGQDAIMKKLLARKEHLEKVLRAALTNREEAQRAAEYTRYGNLLMANLHLLRKGMDAVALDDILGDGGTVRIPLNASLAPAANAERYFTKARKARGAGEEAAERVRETEAGLAALEPVLSALAACEDDASRELFLTTYREQLRSMHIEETDRPGERLPYRSFNVPGGYEVLVGKSSADNDELTFRVAKQHDLWFHVRGSSGSHAILRVPAKTTDVPKEAILAAARIAAYYSKMKNASTVPVAYCERKYVRKPKGAPPGTVTLEREKVVFVDPSLP